MAGHLAVIFHHQELNCLLVLYVDDFKMAGPSENLPKAWASIEAAIDIGEPEAYNLRLPKEAHPFAFAFEAKSSVAAQRRTQDREKP